MKPWAIIAGILAAAGIGAAVWYYRKNATAPASGADAGASDATSADGSSSPSSAPSVVDFAAALSNPFSGLDMSTQPRGIRNNNPGNLDYIPPPHNWDGQVGRDGRFGVYEDPSKGVRAMSKQLQLDYSRGAVTLDDLIAEWAPPGENDTEAYIGDVSVSAGIPRGVQFDLLGNLPAVVAGIIQHENGQQPYSADDIAQWVYLA